MVDSINCMGVLTLRNALNKCKNSLLLAGLNKVTQLGSCPTDVSLSQTERGMQSADLMPAILSVSILN